MRAGRRSAMRRRRVFSSGFRVDRRGWRRTWTSRLRNRVCDAHLNLADGEGEGSVAVVVADDLKLVLLADVENRGGVAGLREGSLGPGAERGSLGADVHPSTLRVAVEHLAGHAVANLVGELVVHEEALELLVELGGVRGRLRGGLGDDGARRNLARRGDGGDGARSLAGEERRARRAGGLDAGSLGVDADRGGGGGDDGGHLTRQCCD
mmetsp:Transcript_6656/g.27669  ORF Transcript_6656/g.27669 Transcript_6656/m.27669 type:complete len:209 (-) Transcript_6656:82-708(-)